MPRGQGGVAGGSAGGVSSSGGGGGTISREEAIAQGTIGRYTRGGDRSAASFERAPVVTYGMGARGEAIIGTPQQAREAHVVQVYTPQGEWQAQKNVMITPAPGGLYYSQAKGYFTVKTEQKEGETSRIVVGLSEQEAEAKKQELQQPYYKQFKPTEVLYDVEQSKKYGRDVFLEKTPQQAEQLISESPERFLRTKKEYYVYSDVDKEAKTVKQMRIGLVPEATLQKFPKKYGVGYETEKPVEIEYKTEEGTAIEPPKENHFTLFGLPVGESYAGLEKTIQTGIPVIGGTYSLPEPKKVSKGKPWAETIHEKETFWKDIEKNPAGKFISDVDYYLMSFAEGAYTEFRESPAKMIALTGLGGGIGYAAKGAGLAGAYATPYVGSTAVKITGFGLQLGGAAVTGIYVGDVGKEMIAAEKERKGGAAYVLGGKVTTEFVPIGVGYKVGGYLGKPLEQKALLRTIENRFIAGERALKKLPAGATQEQTAEALTKAEKFIGNEVAYKVEGGKIVTTEGQRPYPFEQPSKVRAEWKQVESEILKGYKAKESPYRGKEKIPVEQVFKKPEEAAAIREYLTTGKRKVVFGSAAQKAELGPEMQKSIHDIDVAVRGAPETSAKTAASYLKSGKYKPSGGLVVKEGKHVLDIHSLRDLQQYPFSKTPVKSAEGIEMIQIQEQVTRKGIGAYTPGREYRYQKDILGFETIRKAQTAWASGKKAIPPPEALETPALDIGLPTTKTTYPVYAPSKISYAPSYKPSTKPSYTPSYEPSSKISYAPSYKPSTKPSYTPSYEPSSKISYAPSYKPSTKPSYTPSYLPTQEPLPTYQFPPFIGGAAYRRKRPRRYPTGYTEKHWRKPFYEQEMGGLFKPRKRRSRR